MILTEEQHMLAVTMEIPWYRHIIMYVSSPARTLYGMSVMR